MKIVGHRGAAGTEPENTIRSIKKALACKVYAVEFDVHLTKDDHFVLSHDADLLRISRDKNSIRSLTLKQIQDIETLSGEPIPTLKQVLKTIGKKAKIFIELKDDFGARLLADVVESHADLDISITTFMHKQAAILIDLLPNIPVFVAENQNPFEILAVAKSLGAAGVTLNFWLLNPLTYWRLRRRNRSIMVYTVNSRFYAKLISILYPNTLVCTNFPDYFSAKNQTK